MLTAGTIKTRVGYCLINRISTSYSFMFVKVGRSFDRELIGLPTNQYAHSAPRAAPISSSDLPIPTAISTRAFEIASLFPSCISSGVIGIPSFWAIVVTLSTFGLAENPLVNLFKLYCAFMSPWSCEAGSLESCCSKAFYCASLLASASATPASSWAYIYAACSRAHSTVSQISMFSNKR